MAIKRYTINGYGQIEINNVAFRRDGRVEAQCKLDSTDFATDHAENGMLLAVDNVTRTVKYATDGELPIALNYSSEHMYDERANGLKDFSLTKDEFSPRLGYLAIGDKFTTNCVAYDTDDFADEETVLTALRDIAMTPVYGGISNIGAILISTDKPTVGPVLKVVKNTTMPDGQLGLKFQVLSV